LGHSEMRGANHPHLGLGVGVGLGCRERAGRVLGGRVQGACRAGAGRVDLGHELSTGGRSALTPMTWPWCVVRSLHPSSVTGP
jgi:hypothetical protein